MNTSFLEFPCYAILLEKDNNSMGNKFNELLYFHKNVRRLNYINTKNMDTMFKKKAGYEKSTP
ncbi:hypothetical protein [Pedobacter sp.]|uniref:hypothetical protein n=1 Tax=Pedobacter sp. TaxID=1411316 RepID=UPI003D7F2F33